MEEETTLVARTAFQRLMMEQALAMAKELEQAGDAAPDGQVLDQLETLAVARGRDFTRVLWKVRCSVRSTISKKNFAAPPLRMRPIAASQRGVAASSPHGRR